MKYVVGIDLGTSGVKCILLSEDGNILDAATESYSPDFGENGYVEQHPYVWYEKTAATLNALISKNAGIREDIVAVSCSGQMHSSVFLSKDKEVVRPALLWNDTRTTAETKDIYEALGGEANLLEAVSNRALEGFTLPKILWLKKNEPDNYNKVYKVIMPKDYINFMLSGKQNIATDYSDAAGTLLFDVKKAEWSDVMLEKLGISKDILPKAIPSTGIVGKVSKEVSDVTLLPEGTLIVAGGADNSCAAIGNGIIKKGQGVISVGTSGTVIAFIDEIKSKITGDVHLFNYSFPNSVYAMGVMLSAGECLNWLKRTFFEEIPFDALNDLAMESRSGSNGLLFLPYLFGERCPYSNADARGVFFGMNGATSKADFVRSVMEGVAYGIKDLMSLVEEFTPLDDIYITGGGAKSRIWGKIISNVLNKPIKILNIEEGPALGAAFIAGIGSGVYESFEQAAAKTLKVSGVIEPQEPDVSTLSRYYSLYKKLYKDLVDDFSQLKALS